MPESAALAARGLSSGDLFGWREPQLPAGRGGGDRRGGRALAGATARGSSSPATRRRASPSSSTRPAIPAAVVHAPEAPPPGAIALVERSLNGGFEGGPDGLAFVTDRELFGTVRVRRPKAMRRVVPRDILERLTPGDLVVHIDHGVARYERMLRRGNKADGEDRDYLELSFAAGDKIFVPVEQITRISRYSRRRAARSCRKLGGTRVAADEAARPEGRRRTSPRSCSSCTPRGPASRATPSAPTRPWQAEMEASFPYEETPDQLRAAAEVKARHGGRPADGPARRRRRRLRQDRGRAAGGVQGDPGRQAGRGPRPDDGPRGAAPRRRSASGSRRSRCRSGCCRGSSRQPSRRRTLAGLEDGSVDLVIGTHRLLSKDVQFRDLGLVVVDEEQRFGVAAKERLKQLRREVDVLTLSATPIPRTLNLALAGVRDMSVIETPPEDRLPIQTRVAEASAGLVRDAILRELDRGGQVFFVHNRVETIEAQTEQLRRMLPGARFVVGHGQMPEGHLESVMITFAGGEADVLVCTTIIESGLDIPNANTIVIDRADTLGLAQLYQLRGPGRAVVAAGLRLPALPPPRADERGGPQAAPGDLQRVGAGRRVPDRARRPRDPRRRQHPRRRAVRAHGRGRVRPLLAAARGGGRGAQGAARGSAAAGREAAGRRRPAGRGAPARRLRARGGPEARALPAAGPGPRRRATSPRSARSSPTGSGRCRSRSSGSSRSPSCGSRPRRAGVASMSREEGQLVVRFGEGLSRATAMRLLAGGGLPGVKPSRRHVRQQPGPDPPAARPVAGLGPDPGGRGPPVGAGRGGDGT